MGTLCPGFLRKHGHIRSATTCNFSLARRSRHAKQKKVPVSVAKGNERTYREERGYTVGRTFTLFFFFDSACVLHLPDASYKDGEGRAIHVQSSPGYDTNETLEDSCVYEIVRCHGQSSRVSLSTATRLARAVGPRRTFVPGDGGTTAQHTRTNYAQSFPRAQRSSSSQGRRAVVAHTHTHTVQDWSQREQAWVLQFTMRTALGIRRAARAS